MPVPPLDDDPALREALKRYSPATYYAACKFRRFRRSEDLRTLLLGIFEHFVPRELRPRLEEADSLRLREDLAIDSLTMMEVVMIAEEVLQISVSNEEFARLQTFGDVHAFAMSKAAAQSAVTGPIESGANPFS